MHRCDGVIEPFRGSPRNREIGAISETTISLPRYDNFFDAFYYIEGKEREETLGSVYICICHVCILE